MATTDPELELRSVKAYSMPDLSTHQIWILHVTAIVIASLSIVADIVVLTWLLRMKRGFRHDLVMILMLSDLAKAAWMLIFPAVELVLGTIQTESTFCQVSGFFLATSFEMSDISVAMVCFHTAIYVFRGEQGLFPMRRSAYTLSLLSSIVAGTLAFIEKPGYANTGQFCYLPFNPLWKRLLLSWIPRYLALGTILVLCIAIYVYVHVRLSRFGGVGEDSMKSLTKSSNDGLEAPILSENGALYTESLTLPTEGIPEPMPVPNKSDRKGSSSSLGTLQYQLSRKMRPSWLGGSVATKEVAHRRNSSAINPSVLLELGPMVSVREQEPAPSPQVFASSTNTGVIALTAGLEGLQNVTTNHPDMVKTRERILRHVRLLFVYPLVYFAVWVIPFIVHLTRYGKGASFGIRVGSAISLCIQGFANAVVFSWREKPWKHADGFNVSCDRSWLVGGLSNLVGAKVGRTKEEMRMDGKFARDRRDREIADRRIRMESKANTNNNNRANLGWWDNEGGPDSVTNRTP